jgi:hypothetical protein
MTNQNGLVQRLRKYCGTDEFAEIAGSLRAREP